MTGYLPDIMGTIETTFTIGNPNPQDATYNPNTITLSNESGVLAFRDVKNVNLVNIQAATFIGALDALVTDTNTTTITNVLTLDHELNGPLGAGVGAGALFVTAGINLGRVYATYQGPGASTLVLTTYQSGVEQIGITLGSSGVGVGTTPGVTFDVSSANVPGIRLLSTGATTPTSVQIGRASVGSVDIELGAVGASANFSGQAVQGDGVIRTANGNLILRTTTAAKSVIITGGSPEAVVAKFTNGNSIGFYGVTAVTQPSAVGAAAGYTAGTTAATFHSDDTYSGNTGTTKYTLNGVVAALKGLGLLAA